MKLKIERGVIIAGQFVYPKTKGKQSIVNVPGKEAKQLVNTGKASLADKGAKVNVDLLSQEEVDELKEIESEKEAEDKL